MQRMNHLKNFSIVLMFAFILCISLSYYYNSNIFVDTSQHSLSSNTSITTRNINNVSEYENTVTASALQSTTYDSTQTFILDRTGEFYAVSDSEKDDNVLVEVLHSPCTVGVYLQERVGTALWLTTSVQYINEGDNYIFSMPSPGPFRIWAVPLSESDSRITLRTRSFSTLHLHPFGEKAFL